MITPNKLDPMSAVSSLPGFINAELESIATAINAQDTLLNGSTKTLNLTSDPAPIDKSVYADNVITSNVRATNIDVGGKFIVNSDGKMLKLNNVGLPAATTIQPTDTDTDRLNKLISALQSLGIIS